MLTAEEIAREVPNAGSGRDLVEGGQVVLRHPAGEMVWAAWEDGLWKVFASNEDGASMPPQSAREVAEALVRKHRSLHPPAPSVP